MDQPGRIKALRERLGLTQAALAERLGVSFVSVNRWENGQSRPMPLAWRRVTELERQSNDRRLREPPARYNAERSTPRSPLQPMTVTELLELIRNGENSGVEFKRDVVQSHDLAKELVAFLNLSGGRVLLGVDDDRTIHGTTRRDLEEWVMETCRTKIDPPVVPFFEWLRGVQPGKDVAVVHVLSGPDKPYSRIHNQHRAYYLRVGSTSRDASPDELERMFQSSGRLLYGLKPVPGASLDDLDRRRLDDYFGRVRPGSAPGIADDESWIRLLTNVDLMVRIGGIAAPTVDGMLLFGRDPRRLLPQSGIRALAFPGISMDYATRADQDLRGPLVPLLGADGQFVEIGLVEQALDFVRRNTQPEATLVGGRRVDRTEYPEDVVREVVVNALVHRDYSIYGADVMVSLFANRLEVTSPGRLPNTVSVEGLKEGLRYARNQNLVNFMRDYGYVEARGMGIRDKVIPGMRAHNGTEPEFVETSRDFTVRLWKDPPDD